MTELSGDLQGVRIDALRTQPELHKVVNAVFAADEEEIEAVRERARRLMPERKVVVWEADPLTFTFTYVSPEAEDLLGYPPALWGGAGLLAIAHRASGRCRRCRLALRGRHCRRCRPRLRVPGANRPGIRAARARRGARAQRPAWLCFVPARNHVPGGSGGPVGQYGQRPCGIGPHPGAVGRSSAGLAPSQEARPGPHGARSCRRRKFSAGWA